MTSYRAIVVQEASTAVPQQLFLLAHGWDASAENLVPLGRRLAAAFPLSTVVSLEAPQSAPTPGCFEWYALEGVTDENREERIAAALPGFRAEVRAWQRRTGATPAVTAIVGFSQGATMALQSAIGTAHLAARIIAISGRFAALPASVPDQATIHLLHGKEDDVVPYRHTVEAAHRLLQLGSDVTADVVPFIGHTIDDELIELMLQRLRSHVPKRMWEEALRDVPPPASSSRN